jgi:hypothetical protein
MTKLDGLKIRIADDERFMHMTIRSALRVIGSCVGRRPTTVRSRAGGTN